MSTIVNLSHIHGAPDRRAISPLWLFASVLVSGDLMAAEAPAIRDGMITQAPADCQIRMGGESPWQSLGPLPRKVPPEVRIRCASKGVLKIELPGNGASDEVPFDDPKYEYVVPTGNDFPKLRAGGRDARLDAPQQLPTQEAQRFTSATAKDHVQPVRVETCPKKLGVLALAEPQTGWNYLSSYGLGSPAALLRIMVQQSGCFDVVERGLAMQNLQQERSLAAAGEMRQESNIGKGQMQAADFVMTPNVQIAANNTGGVGGFLGGRLGTLGAIAGGLKFKEASTSLLIAEVRSSIQIAASEGSATKTDFSLGGVAWGGGAVGGLGGYTNTPEGKIIAASLLDNYNKVVRQIRDQPTLLSKSSGSSDANAAASTQAGAPIPAGAVLHAKIANVKVYAQASRDSKVVATLTPRDDLVASGEVKNGFVYVDATSFSGWVQRTLVSQ